MSKQRISIIILAAIGMSATFLPWIEFGDNVTINGSEGDGLITLFLFAIPFLISLIKYNKKHLKIMPLIISIISSLLAGVIALWKIIAIMPVAKDETFITLSYGLYVLLFAAILLPTLAIILRRKN
jgi:lipid-A-disaccharide synthase-like uncharacterized protein